MSTVLALILLAWALWAFLRDPRPVLRAFRLVPDEDVRAINEWRECLAHLRYQTEVVRTDG